MSVLNLMVMISIVQGVFLAVSLLSSKYFKSKANQYFAFFIILLVLDLSLGWSDSENIWLDFFWSFMWELLFPVMLFQYLLHFLNHKYIHSTKLKLLYLPFIITFIIDIVFALDYSFHLINLPVKQYSLAWEIITDIEDYSALLYNIIIVSWSFKIIVKDDKNPEYKIKWLKKIFTFIFILIGLWFISDMIDAFFKKDFIEIVWIILSIFFWWVCYIGIYHLKLLEQKSKIHIQQIYSSKKNIKTNPKENEYIQLLDTLMINEKIYKNPDLSRVIVAGKLGISDGYLSQLISQFMQNNFTDYVNSFRIRAVKEMLKDDKYNRYSLTAIGEEAGFKSKSAFYHIFKKTTGLTPGAYQKNFKKS